MSAVWLKIVTILCLCCTELTVAGVMWKDVGQSITIQCNADSDQQLMYLMKGLNQNEQVFYTESTKQKHNIKETMMDRVQTLVNFPKVEILIRNLTVNDTGPYYCLYEMMNSTKKYTNSVLLVVTEKQQARTAAVCGSSSLNEVIVPAVAFAAVLLAIMLLIVLWITKKNTRVSSRPEKTSRHTNNNNDVYEDMRGTIRR